MLAGFMWSCLLWLRGVWAGLDKRSQYGTIELLVKRPYLAIKWSFHYQIVATCLPGTFVSLSKSEFYSWKARLPWDSFSS